MARYEKPDVTVVSGKGQVVIPQAIRKRLGMAPKTRLLVYGYQDAVIMKKIEIPNVTRTLEAIYRRVDAKIAKYGELADREIDEIIHDYRRRRRVSA